MTVGLVGDGDRHHGPRRKSLRIGKERVEIGDGPNVTRIVQRLQRRRIGVVRTANRTTDDAEEVRTEAVGTALGEGVAAGALSGDSFTGCRIRCGNRGRNVRTAG